MSGKKLRSLLGDQSAKFTALVKSRAGGKLSGDECTRLNQHIFADYVRKVKQLAGNKVKQQRHTARESIDRMDRPSSVATSGSTPSFYYTRGTQIMSMKEFVVLLEQSKHKQEVLERRQNRRKQQEFARSVGRSIQSRHSHRDLRLTSSSAHRISHRLIQLQHQNM